MIDTMQQAMAWLNQYAPTRMSLGLERMRALQAALPLQNKERAHIVIAGTNGKGSTASMLASICQLSNRRCSLATSPHLHFPNERIRYDGKPIAPTAFYALLNALAPISNSLQPAPTTFEVLIAAALLYADKMAVDESILEVGLGGRLDATNVVSKKLCVITPIGYDHQAILGHSLREIAREKAGIYAQGVPVVLAEQPPEAEEVLLTLAQEQQCPVVLAKDIPLPAELQQLPLYQQSNAKTALAAARVLGLPTAKHVPGILALRWPGRYQWLLHPGNIPILLDGAHNVDGMHALWRSIGQDNACQQRDKVGLVGFARDKDIGSLLGPMQQGCQRLLLCSDATQPRLLAGPQLAAYARPQDELMPSIDTALTQLAAWAQPEQMVIAAGSLLLVGMVLAWFEQHGGQQAPLAEQPYGLGLDRDGFSAAGATPRKDVPPW